MKHKTISNYFADFAVQLGFEDIPDKSVRNIKNHIIDCIGVGLAGAKQETPEICFQVFQEKSGTPESSVYAHKLKLPSTDAAFINGTATHSIELDDGSSGSQVHPGACIVPTVLATCEQGDHGGKDFILASLIGYEITIRLAKSMFPHHRRLGFHPTGTCGTFGAAAAAGKMIGLNKKEMINAFGLAGTFASGIREGTGPELMMKRLHAGKAASNGILSALLAKKGFQAPESIFDGDNGFLKLFSKEYDPNILLENLGQNFITDESYYKAYACCRHIHAPIDSLLGIMETNQFELRDVKEINVKIYKEGTFYKEDRPQSVLDAQFSLPYVLAVVLKEKRALIDQFSEEKFKDEEILSIASKVTVEFDQDLDNEFIKTKKRAHILRIELQDGRIFENRVNYPKGSFKNPFSYDDVVTKFMDLSTIAVSKEKALKIIEFIDNLESKLSIEELINLLN